MISNQSTLVSTTVAMIFAGTGLAADDGLAITRFLSKDGAPLTADWQAAQGIPTFIVIHGFQARGTDVTFTQQANAIQRRFPQSNVVIVDWTLRVESPKSQVGISSLWTLAMNLSAEYRRAVHAGAGIAVDIAQWIKRQNIDPSLTAICGHSLGAQIAARVSNHLLRPEVVGRRIHTILAADPAGPSFSDKPAKDRLDRNDAEEVIVVHTTDSLGDNRVIGSLDIYVTWPQSNTPDQISRHSRARELVTRSFDNPGMATNQGLQFGANAIDRHYEPITTQSFIVAEKSKGIPAR